MSPLNIELMADQSNLAVQGTSSGVWSPDTSVPVLRADVTSVFTTYKQRPQTKLWVSPKTPIKTAINEFMFLSNKLEVIKMALKSEYFYFRNGLTSMCCRLPL